MEDFGSGLSSFLSAHQEKISGIINGLDTIRWDPATDNKIMVNFSVDKIIKRSANKSFLQEAMGLLNDAEIPLLAMVTRMDPQKGVDLAVSAIRSILKSSTSSTTSLQAVFLGKGGPILEKSVRQLEKDFPNQLRARIMYDERLSHHIYAGADAFLMPSRYEPCGLSQMIAMHYGCVPIARATGGLSDTIHDPASSGNATGFLFPHPKPAELAKTIQRALEIYFHDPQAWQEIQINGMRQDFSWNRSAEEYLKRYKMILR